MDEQGNYHECDNCDWEEGWHRCPCGVLHVAPVPDDEASAAQEGEDG